MNKTMKNTMIILAMTGLGLGFIRLSKFARAKRE